MSLTATKEGAREGTRDPFDMTGRVAVITGGAGLLGVKHAEALAAAGAAPVLLDLPQSGAGERARSLAEEFGVAASAVAADITRAGEVGRALEDVLARYGRVDVLVNNAANNPKMESREGVQWSRLENFPLEQWEADLAVGLTGAFLCRRAFGAEMARGGRGGVILNVASDLAVIAPDQRIYRQEGLPDDEQPVKPVTYSVVKTGLVGLTRYLATYWAEAGVRVNAISPGGVSAGQAEEFVSKLTNLIPLGRMARADEYKSAVLFLCSDASSYMTGQNLIIDGGRSCW
jgi:NAD(P)-dependent dehydrogenase (short-subunit alcohol dehydrogenase family)